MEQKLEIASDHAKPNNGMQRSADTGDVIFCKGAARPPMPGVGQLLNRMKFPSFKYHPDPVATGSVEPSDVVCEACGRAGGFIYKGPVYAEEELVDVICPWCIADGTAHEKFGAEFVDAAGVGGYGEWQRVSPEIADEVACRTPGFNGWQQEKWFTHCNDAGEFLGPAGMKELERFGAEAMSAIRKESGLGGEEWDFYLKALDKQSGPTAYIFKCRHCGALGGYSDCH